MRTLHLFAGAGGGILADIMLGHRPVCAVECDDYAQRVLQARINDGCLPWFPIFRDVRTFDGTPWRGLVDCVSGGFPCQDISAAGKGAGITGERSGLWKDFARIIRDVRPKRVFVENSPMLTSRGLGTVLGDLAALGYDARWGVLGACDVGAPHKRDRIWILADTVPSWEWRVEWEIETKRNAFHISCGYRWNERIKNDVENTSGCGREKYVVQFSGIPSGPSESMANPDRMREPQPQGTVEDERGRTCDGGEELAHAMRVRQSGSREYVRPRDQAEIGDWKTNQPFHVRQGIARWWKSEPNVGGMVDGVAYGLDIHGANGAEDVGRVAVGVPNRANRLKCIGNGQVPACAALAWETLTQTPWN